MSASKQKRVRNDLRADGIDKKTEAQLEAEKKNKKFRRNSIIAVVIVVLVLAASILINSTFFYTKVSAVNVAGTDYSAAEFNYYFRSTYSTFVNNYGNYVSLFFDTQTSLSKQNCAMMEDENATWSDYFTEQATNQIIEVTALYDAAVANGYAMTEEQLTSIDNEISAVESYANYYGYSPDAYLALTYGKGMDEAFLRQVLTRYYTAMGYGQSVYNGFTYTDEECVSHYAEIADQYDVISYNYYLCSTSLDEYGEMEDEAKTAAAHAAAHAAAEGIAAAATQQEFADKVYEVLSDADKEAYTGIDSTFTSTLGANISSDYSEWLLDSARVAGDTYVCDTSSGSYAIMFIERNNNDYNTVNARHILISAVADENGEYTDEALAAAEASAQEIYAKWKEDPTEDNFAALAQEYSEDTGSNTNGGLYERIYQGQMVEEVNAFCFGDRKPGDTAVVFGSDGSYTGYHIVYFVGEGPNYASYIAENDLRTNDYSDFVNALKADYTSTTGFGYKFTDRN